MRNKYEILHGLKLVLLVDYSKNTISVQTWDLTKVSDLSSLYPIYIHKITAQNQTQPYSDYQDCFQLTIG